MTTLANAHSPVGHIAVQNGFAAFVAGVGEVIASFSRAIAFSRQCEAEFNSHGQVNPETLKKLLHQV